MGQRCQSFQFYREVEAMGVQVKTCARLWAAGQMQVPERGAELAPRSRRWNQASVEATA